MHQDLEKTASELEPLPPLKDISDPDQQILFITKVNLCNSIFNFDDPLIDIRGKEIKSTALNELVNIIGNPETQIKEAVYSDIIKMIAKNIFEKSPPDPTHNLEEDEPAVQSSWPHLQLVYEIFIRFLTSSNFQSSEAEKFLDQLFVSQLLDLFNSNNPKERDFLKAILYEIYEKIRPIRPFIRKYIKNIFLRFITESFPCDRYSYETEKFNGIAELLEILCSIVEGFELPLKGEHIEFLLKVMIPMHKSRELSLYHDQISCCMIQFLEKDPSLAELIIRNLRKIWPKTCSQKEVLFLMEIEQLLELTNSREFLKFVDPLFRQLAQCSSSTHYQVAKTALHIWKNKYVYSLINKNINTIMPIVYPPLYRMSKEHWNPATRALMANVLNTCRLMDSKLFDMLTADYKKSQANLKKKAKQSKELWKKLEKL